MKACGMLEICYQEGWRYELIKTGKTDKRNWAFKKRMTRRRNRSFRGGKNQK